MKKLLIIGIIFLNISSCKESNTLYSDKTLTKKIEMQLESESEIVDLSIINSFEWNTLLIIGPYTEIEPIEKKLNLDLKNIKPHGIEYDDSINLLVFLKNRKSVKISEVSRHVGDFTTYNQIIPKHKAKFIKMENGQNTMLK